MQDSKKAKNNSSLPLKTTIPLYNNRNCGNSIADFGCDKLSIYLNQDQFAWKKERLKGWGQKIITTDLGTSEAFFYNPPGEGFNLDISKDKTTQKEYLTISTNPSKILHPFKLTNDADFITDHLGNITKHLEEKFSIHLDMEQAKVSRYDLAHNIELNHEMSEYTSVLNSFQPKRQITKTHSDSCYWTNKTRQTIFYNKKQDLLDKGYNQDEWKINNNLVRLENRILNASGIKTTYGCNKLSNILIKMPNNIEVFNSFIKDNLFREQKIPQLKLDFGEIEDIMHNMILRYGTKQGYRMVIESLGINYIASLPNGINRLNKLIDKTQKKRTAYNLKQRNNILLNVYNPMNIDLEDNSFMTLNKEIRFKFLVAA